MVDAFEAALDALDSPATDPASYSTSFVDVFPVSGAAVSTVGDLLGSETLSASDVKALDLDELQFDFGEGPCWDAMWRAKPVLEPDLSRREVRSRWPAFGPAALDLGVVSMFAFPLMLGPLRFGAVDLYSRHPVQLDHTQTRQAGVMASVLSRHILRNALAEIDQPDDGNRSPYSRRRVHQATGVVLAQLDISADDARLMLQGHAFAVNQTMMSVAEDVISGRLRFSKESGAIEVTP